MQLPKNVANTKPRCFRPISPLHCAFCFQTNSADSYLFSLEIETASARNCPTHDSMAKQRRQVPALVKFFLTPLAHKDLIKKLAIETWDARSFQLNLHFLRPLVVASRQYQTVAYRKIQLHLFIGGDRRPTPHRTCSCLGQQSGMKSIFSCSIGFSTPDLGLAGSEIASCNEKCVNWKKHLKYSSQLLRHDLVSWSTTEYSFVLISTELHRLTLSLRWQNCCWPWLGGDFY